MRRLARTGPDPHPRLEGRRGGHGHRSGLGEDPPAAYSTIPPGRRHRLSVSTTSRVNGPCPSRYALALGRFPWARTRPVSVSGLLPHGWDALLHSGVPSCPPQTGNHRDKPHLYFVGDHTLAPDERLRPPTADPLGHGTRPPLCVRGADAVEGEHVADGVRGDRAECGTAGDGFGITGWTSAASSQRWSPA